MSVRLKKVKITYFLDFFGLKAYILTIINKLRTMTNPGKNKIKVAATRKKRAKPKKFTKLQIANLHYYAARHKTDYVAELYGMSEEVFIASLEADQELAELYQKARNGRPKKTLTNAQMNELGYHAARCSDEQLADLYGMDSEVFKNLIKADEQLFRAYKKGRAEMSLAVTNVLLDSILEDRNLTSVYFYKKCVDGWSENKGKQETSQEDNNTIVTLKVIDSQGRVITPGEELTQ